MRRLEKTVGQAARLPSRGAFLAAFLLLLALLPTPLRAESLTLADCLRETAAHNPEILAQQRAIEQTTGARLTFRARALPTLTVGGILGYLGEENTETLRVTTRDPNTGKKITTNVNNTRSATELIIGTGELSQPIFDAAIPASWRRGDLGITVAQENFYTVASEQLHETRTLFYQALFQQENGVVLHRLDEGIGNEITSINQLVTAGLAGRQPLLAAQVQRTNFGSAILAATGGYSSTVTSLLQNMGRDLGPDTDTTRVHLSGLLEERPVDFDAAATARAALARRPDLRALRVAVRQINEDANIVRAGYYPNIRLYVAGELIPQTFVQHTQTNSVRQSDQTQTTEVRPGVRGNWTIIDTGNVRGNVRALEAQRDEVGIALRRLERDLPSSLTLVHARMTGAANRIAALRGNVGTADNTLTMIQNGVAQGLNSQLEYLDAQTGVLSARSGLLVAQLEMSTARAEFDRLTGRYLDFVQEPPSSIRK